MIGVRQSNKKYCYNCGRLIYSRSQARVKHPLCGMCARELRPVHK